MLLLKAGTSRSMPVLRIVTPVGAHAVVYGCRARRELRRGRPATTAYAVQWPTRVCAKGSRSRLLRGSTVVDIHRNCQPPFPHPRFGWIAHLLTLAWALGQLRRLANGESTKPVTLGSAELVSIKYAVSIGKDIAGIQLSVNMTVCVPKV
jgi:hypothetical protein